MSRPLLLLIAALGFAVGGHYLLFMLYPEARESDTLNFGLSLIANVIAAFMYVWVLSLFDLIERSPSAQLRNSTPTELVRWSRFRVVGVLATTTFVAALLSQAFIDAFWIHAQEMVEARLLTPEGKQRLGIYFLGLVPTMIWAPLVTYASLSIGRRCVFPPQYLDHMIGAAIGLGVGALWYFFADYRDGELAPIWQIFPKAPGDSPRMKTYDNAIGYVLQVGMFVACVIFYSGWTKLWSWIGGFLYRKGIA